MSQVQASGGGLDQAAIERGAGEAQTSFYHVLEQLSPEFRQDLLDAGHKVDVGTSRNPSVDFELGGGGGYSPWDSTVNVGAGLVFHNPGDALPASSFDMPYDDFGAKYEDRYRGPVRWGQPVGEGTLDQVMRHEVGHAIDELMAKGGWSNTPEGRNFFGRGFVSPAAGDYNPKGNEEFMASIIDKAMRTGVIPASYGQEFYEKLKEHIPELERMDLDLAGARAEAQSPYQAYVQAAGDDTLSGDELQRAEARYLFAGDARDADKSTSPWTPAAYLQFPHNIRPNL